MLLRFLFVLLSAVALVTAQTPTPTFLARTDYPEAGAYGVALGDFNNDGILDIAFLEGGPVQVLFNNGDGTFRAGPLNTTFGADLCMAVGDFNGDGKLDIVVGDRTGTIQVGFGNGDGTFTAQPKISLPEIVPIALTVADVNGDGLPDILVGTSGLLVFLNQGGGAFGPYTTYFANTDALCSAVGDVNGDAIADIVVGTGSGAQVLLGTGSGNFQDGQTIPLQHVAGTLVLADMNGDGNVDLVATAGNPTYDPLWTEASVLLGNGNGTFTPHSNVKIPEGVYGVQVGDINGDGLPDLALLQNNSEYQVSVAFNKGDATFTTPISWTTANSATGFALGALRKPGLLDIVVAGNFSYFLSVLLNEGKGTFEDGSRIYMSTPPGPFAAADFNGDGLTDFAVLGSSGVSIFQNSSKGYGPFTPVNSIALANPNWIVAADFNKDGHPDLAVSLSGGGIAILLGQGGGQFSSPTMISTSAPVSMFVVGDFNGDGKIDIAATSNQIYFGNGDGTFAVPQPIVSGTVLTKFPLFWLEPIRISKHNYLDLAILNQSIEPDYEQFRILFNNGKGSFNFGAYTTVAAMGSQMAIADFNGDGNADAIISDGGFLYLLTGDGAGNFDSQQLTCSGCHTATSGITTGDFNGDGFDDFAAGTGQNVSVYLSKGDGTFQDPSFVGTSPGPSFLQWVDLQSTHSGLKFAFAVSSGDGLDLEIESSK